MNSIIIPVDLSRRPASLQRRTDRIVVATRGTEFEVVVALSDRGTQKERDLKDKLESESHARIVSVPTSKQITNTADLRNKAVDAATGDILLLLDADIAPDLDLFLALCHEVATGAPLSMAPCLYLSQEGTHALDHGRKKEELVESALAFSPCNTLHWAIPSSVIAIRKVDYLEIGGFSDSYCGHGYEDFDFIMRMAYKKKILDAAPDSLIDQTYRAPMLAVGFRSKLGTICISNLLEGNIALHRFHQKEERDPYYKTRKRNAQLFRNRMAELLSITDDPKTSFEVPLVAKVLFEECERRNLSPEKYYALFDARPRYMLARKSIFRRLLKKLCM